MSSALLATQGAAEQSLIFLEFDGEPGAGIGPPGVRGARGNAEDFGRLSEGQPGEMPQLDKYGKLRVRRGQPRQRVVQGFDSVVRRETDQMVRFKIDTP